MFFLNVFLLVCLPPEYNRRVAINLLCGRSRLHCAGDSVRIGRQWTHSEMEWCLARYQLSKEILDNVELVIDVGIDN